MHPLKWYWPSDSFPHLIYNRLTNSKNETRAKLTSAEEQLFGVRQAVGRYVFEGGVFGFEEAHKHLSQSFCAQWNS